MDIGAIVPIILYAAVFAFLVYALFWPAILAFRKAHPARWAILIANIVLGWTVIGWIIVMIWALRGKSATQSPAFMGADSMKVPPPDGPASGNPV